MITQRLLTLVFLILLGGQAMGQATVDPILYWTFDNLCEPGINAASPTGEPTLRSNLISPYPIILSTCPSECSNLDIPLPLFNEHFTNGNPCSVCPNDPEWCLECAGTSSGVPWSFDEPCLPLGGFQDLQPNVLLRSSVSGTNNYHYYNNIKRTSLSKHASDIEIDFRHYFGPPLALDIDATGIPPFEDQMTVEFLMKTEEDYWGGLVMAWQDVFRVTFAEWGLSFRIESAEPSEEILFDFYFDGAGRKSAEYYLDKEWHHFAIVFDGKKNGKFQLYVDGQCPAGFTRYFGQVPAINNLANADFMMSAPSSGNFGTNHPFNSLLGNYINASLDEVAIFDEALSLDWIQMHYQNSIQQHGNYVFSEPVAGFPEIEDPVATIQETYEFYDYPPGYIYPGIASVPDAVAEPLEQLCSYPNPRYRSSHKLSAIFSGWFGGFYEDNATDAPLAREFVSELVHNWNWSIPLGGADQYRSLTPGVTAPVSPFNSPIAKEMIDLANDEPELPRCLVTHWGHLVARDYDGPAGNFDDGEFLTKNGPFVSLSFLDEAQGTSAWDNTRASLDFYLNNGCCKLSLSNGGGSVLSPSLLDFDPSIIHYDGQIMKSYIDVLFDGPDPNYKLTIPRIDYINENGEVAPGYMNAYKTCEDVNIWGTPPACSSPAPTSCITENLVDTCLPTDYPSGHICTYTPPISIYGGPILEDCANLGDYDKYCSSNLANDIYENCAHCYAGYTMSQRENQWRHYITAAKYDFRRRYRDEFLNHVDLVNSGGISVLKSKMVKFSWYNVCENLSNGRLNPYYNSRWIHRPFIDGHVRSTPFYYPQSPRRWFASQGNIAGMSRMLHSAYMTSSWKNRNKFSTSLASSDCGLEGDYFSAPFVSPGFNYDNSIGSIPCTYCVPDHHTIRPGQYLGALKSLVGQGAEYFHPFEVYYHGPDPNSSESKATWRSWKAAPPSYAQAIISHAEDLFMNSKNVKGCFRNGDRNAFGNEIRYGDLILNDEGVPQDLVVARQEYSLSTTGGVSVEIPKERYLISGTVQKMSNMQNTAPVAKDISAKLGEDGPELTFEVRRQGSMYVYDEESPYNSVAPLFYQLDFWHEAKDPSWWCKDFWFEAEVEESKSKEMVRRTERPAGAAAGDFTEYTTYLRVKKGVQYDFPTVSDCISNPAAFLKKVEYRFQPRVTEQETLSVWLRVRRRLAGTYKGGMCIEVIDVETGTVVYRDYTQSIGFNWDWIKLSDPIAGLTLKKEYDLRVKLASSDIEIDKILLRTVDDNWVDDVNTPVSFNHLISCTNLVDFTPVHPPTPCVEYHWDFGDGFTSNIDRPQHQYTGPGTYSVVLTITNPINGSQIQSAQDVVLTSTPPIIEEEDMIVCPGSTITLQGYLSNSCGTSTHSWRQKDENGVWANLGPDPTFTCPVGLVDKTVTVNEDTWFYLDQLTPAGCVVRDSIYVMVSNTEVEFTSVPAMSPVNEVSLNCGSNISIVASGAAYVNWKWAGTSCLPDTVLDCGTLPGCTYTSLVGVPGAIIQGKKLVLGSSFFTAPGQYCFAAEAFDACSCNVASPDLVYFYINVTGSCKKGADAPTPEPEPIVSGNIDLFPNPTSGEVTVQYEKAVGLTALEVFGMQGMRVFNFSAKELENDLGEVMVNLSGYSSGIYLFKFHTVDGVETRRIVVQ